MKPLADLSFTVNTYNKLLQRLYSGKFHKFYQYISLVSYFFLVRVTFVPHSNIGPLLGDMVDHLVKKSNNKLKPDRKLWIYSAHDNTVSSFLNTLNLFDLHCPPYTATVLLELRLNSLNEHVVTVGIKTLLNRVPMIRCNNDFHCYTDFLQKYVRRTDSACIAGMRSGLSS